MIALVWRESVYKNDFRCNVCGKKLFDVKGGAVKCVKIKAVNGRKLGFCRRCNNPVFHIEPYHGDAKPGTLAGLWEGDDT